MSDLTEVQREKIKLSATFSNNLAIALFGICGLSPMMAVAFKKDIADSAFLMLIIWCVVIFCCAMYLHYHAIKWLERLMSEGTPIEQLRMPK